MEERLRFVVRLLEGEAMSDLAREFGTRVHIVHLASAEAVPLLEEQLANDRDGSLHVQLARAYTSLGQRDKAAPLLTKSQELQKADEERRAVLARRAIMPPK
jgi:tetratricopeptide (TPR) repeat protein